MSTSNVIAVNAEKSATRNFYATRINAKGESVPYAFETSDARGEWVERRGDKAKKVSALEVYKLMNKNSRECIVANKQHRLIKIKAGDVLEDAHRMVIK